MYEIDSITESLISTDSSDHRHHNHNLDFPSTHEYMIVRNIISL